MPDDTELERRVMQLLKRRKGYTRKAMFGGVGFLLNGNLCAGVYKQELILRLGPDAAAAALRKPHVKPFDITGKALTGWVMVEAESLQTENELSSWLKQAHQFVKEFPVK